MKNKLKKRGIIFPDDSSVYIDEDINIDNIHTGTIIHPGCRISGKHTSIGPDCEIGYESPVTIRNCQIGQGVKISGGFLEETVILDYATAGDGFHSRPGTILEEKSSVAHTVGLKQTILMPYVVLGSTINFCDIIMGGGTGSDNHSEVGSSYIHFNFTTHQDKATASLLGDVPNGVMLDKNPIFLGGQGGLVGPRRIAFGTTVAAGIILRRDITEENLLIAKNENNAVMSDRSYNYRQYGSVKDKISNCFNYLGNLLALKSWYMYVRKPFFSRTGYGVNCFNGAVKCLDCIWQERIYRLDQLAAKFELSIKSAGNNIAEEHFLQQQDFINNWPDIKKNLECLYNKESSPEYPIMEIISKLKSQSGQYLDAVKNLSKKDSAILTEWLNKVGQTPVIGFN